MTRVLICCGVALIFLTCLAERVRAEESMLYQSGGSVYQTILKNGKVQSVQVSKSDEEVLDFGVFGSDCLLVVKAPNPNAAGEAILKDMRGDLNVTIVGASLLPHVECGGPIAFNGKAVAYVAIEDKKYSLAVLDLGTGKSKTVITQPDKPLCSPKWSPDGKSVAYYSANNGANFSLEILKVSDGTRMVVSPASAPTGFGTIRPRPPFWAGDGKKLYFEAAYNDKVGPNLYEVSADGAGAPRHVCAGLCTAFDPVSGIAFVVRKLNVYSVLVTKPDSEPKLEVEQAWWARISGSGELLGYSWSNTLYIRKLSDGSSTEAVRGYGGDGSRTAWGGKSK